MSNARKLRLRNPGSGMLQRNKREWSGQPGNRVTQLRLAEEQRQAEEAAKKPRFILRPKAAKTQ